MSVVGVGTNYYSAFNPLNLGDCALWLDAADTSTLTLSGSNVTQWNDKSGNSRHLSQATAGNQPTYSTVNQRSFVNFTAANSNFMSNTSMTIDYRTSQIFLVFQRKTVQSGLNPGLFAPLTAGQSGDWTRTDGFEISTSVEVGSAGSGASDSQLSNLNLTTYAFSINNNNLTTFRDFGSNSVITRAMGLTAVPNALYLGIRRDGPSLNYPSDVYFGEALVYNRLLSTSEYQQVEGYLAKKWGLGGGTMQSIIPFSPTNVTGCQLWLDAADSNSVTESGGSITNVTNKGNSSIVLSNANGFTYDRTNKAFTNSVASSSRHLGINSSYSQAQPQTLFVVAAFTSSASNPYLIDSRSTQIDVGRFGYSILRNGANTADVAYAFAGNTQGPDFGLRTQTNISSNTTVLHTLVMNNTNSDVRLNGVTQTYSQSPGTNSMTGITVGNRYTDNYSWVGSINEILLYGRGLTLTERQTIEGYLANKWGLTSSLPASHPYARAPRLPTTHPYSSIVPMTRGFAPIDVPGLQLWLDAADPNSMTLSGSNVIQWRDKSSNNYSSTVYNSPTYSSNSLNGFPGVTFNGTSQYMDFGNVLNIGTSAIYIFILSKFDSTANAGIIGKTSYRGGVTGRWALLRDSGSGGLGYLFDNNGPTTSSFVADTSTTTRLLTLYWDRSNVFLLQNGSQLTTTSMASSVNFTGTDPLYVAAYPNGTGTGPQTGYYFPGKIGEILVYLGSLTSFQRQQVEGYLARKWGLASVQASPPLPTTISGINAWYDGADPLGTGVPPSVNTSLGTWYDKSGNGRNASGGVSPTFVSGGVSFNGSSSYLNMSIPYSSNYSIFLVATNTSVSQVYFFGRDSLGGGREPTFIQGYIGAGIGLEWYESSDRATIATTPSSPFIASIDHTQGSSIQGYYFGTQSFNISQTRTYFSNAWDTLGRPGAGTAAGWYGGIMKELIFFSNTLTTTQRQQVEGYLAVKWGLQGSLPSTHPYALRGLPSTHPFISRLPVTTVFNPRQISGCQLWLDAADPSTLTLSSSNISQWSDKSGNSRHATQFNTGFATYNGSNQVTISPTGQLASSIPSGTFSSAVSAFVVFQSYASNSYNALISRTVGGLPAPFDMYTSADVGGSRILIGNGTAYANGYPTNISFANTLRTMYAFIVPGSLAWNQSVNGSYSSLSISANAGAAYADNGSNVVIGSRNDKFTVASIYVYEIILYNSILTTTQRQQVEGYLAWKWGLNGGYSPSIAPFTPTSVTGCQLWLDAADSNSLVFSFTGTATLNQYVTTTAQTVPYVGTMTSVSNINGGTCFMNGAAINGGNGRSGFLAPSSSILGVASLNQYVTTSPQTVTYTGTLSSLSSFTGGTCFMNGAAINFGNGVDGVLCPSASNGVWYGCDLTGAKIVKMQFALNGSTLTVQGLSAAYLEPGGISPSKTGSSNDALYASASPTSIATSSSSSSYGVARFSMNFTSSASSDTTQWYAYSMDGTTCKVVKLEFKLTGSTLTVQGITAGFLGSNYLSSSNSGATNDSYFSGYSLSTIATSSSTGGYGVANFTANFTSSTPTSGVSQWNDKSGNGRNTSTVYGTPQINTSGFNGLPAVYFGSGAGLTGPITNTGTLLSVFVVARLGGSTAGRRVFSLGQAKRSDSALATDVAALTIGNLTTQLGWFRNNTNAVVTTIYNAGFIYNLVMNGSTGVIWLNSTSTASTNSSGNFGYSTYGLGVQFDNLGDAVGVYPTLGDGFIAEVLVYNAALSTTDRQNIEGYLANKWGLTGSLPSTHPYTNRSLPSTHPYKLIQPGFINMNIPLVFTYAWYGSTNGGSGKSVTSTVQSVYDSGAATITLGNGTFGDPQPGVAKYTWITYTKSGTSYSIGPYGEGTVLTFSSL